jgi:hypothetical protein
LQIADRLPLLQPAILILLCEQMQKHDSASVLKCCFPLLKAEYGMLPLV